MASPTFLGDGSTPRRSDPRWVVLQKILGATVDGGGGGGGSGQILSGAAPPAAPDDPSQAAIFYPDGGGSIQQWDIVGQAWV